MLLRLVRACFFPSLTERFLIHLKMKVEAIVQVCFEFLLAKFVLDNSAESGRFRPIALLEDPYESMRLYRRMLSRLFTIARRKNGGCGAGENQVPLFADRVE